ncbi:MAG: hypothetical protein ACRD26_07915, partial [Vicinamibacterales bacterium]
LTVEVFQFLTLSRSIYSSTATKLEIGWVSGIRTPIPWPECSESDRSLKRLETPAGGRTGGLTYGAPDKAVSAVNAPCIRRI